MSFHSATSPGRPVSFDRDVALEKALNEFWRHGYHATSIASLTAAMGIQPPSLYAAFGDKRTLFRECVKLYQDRFDGGARALTEEPTARQVIERILHYQAGQYTDEIHPPGCLLISATVVYGPTSADVADELHRTRDAFKQAIADRISQDVREQRLPADTDVIGLATFYVTVVQGMSRQAQDGATGEHLRKVADLAMAAWPPTSDRPQT